MAAGTISMFLHTAAKLAYVMSLITLTFLWPSLSLIVMTGLHVLLVALVMGMYGSTDSKGKEPTFLRQLVGGGVIDGMKDKKKDYSSVEFLAFHFMDVGNHVFIMVHTLVLLVNLAGFLTMTADTMPPTTLRINGVMQDHTLFGAATADNVANLHAMAPEQVMGGVQLAQSGYYYAEEYTGYFGTNQERCGGASGWRCFAVGVRSYRGTGPQRSKTSIDSVYQPLPTPAYSVDVQVAVSARVGDNTCTEMASGIYIQHVTGKGNVLGAYRGVHEFALDVAGNHSHCPGGTGAGIGCVTGQRQDEAAYIGSLRGYCTSMRVPHTDEGYSASYLKIPGEMSTVDPKTGAIRHTIIIMKTSTPPILRVTQRHSKPPGSPFRAMFTPVVDVHFPRGGDATAWRQTESSPGYPVEMQIAQEYGYNAPNATLRDVSIPADYVLTNYYSTLWLYVSLIVGPMVISWYYWTTVIAKYQKMSFIFTGLLVRFPLAMLGLMSGSIPYFGAQISLLFAYMMRMDAEPKDAKERDLLSTLLRVNRSDWTFFIFIAISVVLNGIHMGTWTPGAIRDRDRWFFIPYARETPPPWFYPEWNTGLLVPILAMFLLLEPAVSTVLQGSRVLLFLYRGMSPKPRG